MVPKTEGDKISTKMWMVITLINLSALMYGYVLVGFNACLVVGNRGSTSACYNGDDDQTPPCPKGSVYDDLPLTLGTCCTPFTFLLNDNFHISSFCKKRKPGIEPGSYRPQPYVLPLNYNRHNNLI